MKKILFVTAITAAFLAFCHQAGGQTKPTSDLPKYEVAPEFTVFNLYGDQTEVGVGGRFTVNINKGVALEAAGYFSPGTCDTCAGQQTGRIAEGLFGVKAGKRFSKVGIFAKARPGFMTIGKGYFDFVPTSGGFVTLVPHRLTPFALDLGGVFEFYPSKKIVIRVDYGDTILHYRQYSFIGFDFNPVTLQVTPVQRTQPAHTTHNSQFIAGVGFRF
ncbi:MAG TPA: hypothetical protein VGJ69_10765 [Pyrinomonadaceae bacterium]